MLLVDMGNSLIKWGTQEHAKLTSGQAFANDLHGLAQSMEAVWGKLQNPNRVVVSNVAGLGLANFLKDWVFRRWHVKAQFVESQAKAFGVQNAYDDATELGVDRWVGLVALRHQFDLPACLIDCGTAITLDFLDRQGIHRGGLIMPGLSLMRKSLMDGTHGIAVSGTEVGTCLADNTGSAIGNGTLIAAGGFADLALRRLISQGEIQPSVVVTGGHAQSIAALVSVACVYEPDLILKGLSIIAENES